MQSGVYHDLTSVTWLGFASRLRYLLQNGAERLWIDG